MYHAGLLEYIRKVLRCVCFNCSRLLLDKNVRDEVSKMKITSRFSKVLRHCDPVSECAHDKGGCGHKQPKFTKSGLRIQVEYKDDSQKDFSKDRK